MNAILSQKWAIQYDYAHRALALYLRSLDSGHNLIRKQSLEEFSAQVALSYDSQVGVPFAEGRKGRVAIIPMIGPMTKYGDLCSLGMQDYEAALSRVNASPEYEGTVAIMDTPGGTVDGTPSLANAIATSTKPVVVFADGIVASAGIWLSSQSDYIVANKNNPTEFGSIGVLLALPNIENMVKAGQHPEITIYRASKSVNKARINMVERPDDRAQEEIQASLDETNKDFIAAVKAGRGVSLDASATGLFDGSMFSAKEAKRIGLIDSIGTLDDAVSKVSALAKTGRTSKASASVSDQESVRASAQSIQEQTNESDEMKLIEHLSSALSALKAALVQPAPETSETPGETQPEETPATDPVETQEQPQEQPSEATSQEIAAIRAELDAIRSEALGTINTLRSENANLTKEVASLTEQLSKFQTAGAPKVGDQNFRTDNAQGGNRVAEWKEKNQQSKTK